MPLVTDDILAAAARPGWPRTSRRVALLFLPLLAACSASPDAAPGAITADEAQALNDAAAMLEANSVDANALAAPPQ